MDISEFPVWKRSGINPSDHLSFAERLEVQTELADHMDAVLGRMNRECRGGFVTDRSPIDLMAYLLSNVDSTCSRLYDSAISCFSDQCIDMVDQHLDRIYVVGMFSDEWIPTKEKEGKIYSSIAYRSLIDLVIKGTSTMAPDIIRIIPFSAQKVEERVEWVYQDIIKSYH